MNFLLIAPLRTESVREGRHAITATQADATQSALRSRRDCTTFFLTQEISSIELSRPDTAQFESLLADTGNGTEILETISYLGDPQNAREFLVGEFKYVTFEVQVDPLVVPSPTDGRISTNTLEESLSIFAEAICAESYPRWTYTWTSRYALPEGGEQIRADWLAPQNECLSLNELAESNDPDFFSAYLSWGNGIVNNWKKIHPDTKLEFLKGVIDAQHVWMYTVALKEELNVLSQALRQAGFPVKRNQLRLFSEEVSRLLRSVDDHKLRLDEVYGDIQALRRDTATRLLKAWDHDHQMQRIDERTTSLHKQVNDISERASHRSMQLTETLLLALSGLAILDTGLSFISTVYSGDVDKHPGSDFSFSLFNYFRGYESDYLFFLLIALSSVVTAYLLQKKVNN